RELWRQHHGAARRYAASLTRRFDPDDLVSEAFLRIFSAMQNGGGPTGALRPYLFVTIRNIAARWARLPGERSLDDIEEP
ncbi:RNA polymerase sigma factor, partial [Staphylococcus aureus]